jgi:hypothetical protein
MAIVDLYRQGYERGYQAAVTDQRRLARWELLARSPITWLPGLDADSYVNGYNEGYRFGLMGNHWQVPGN